MTSLLVRRLLGTVAAILLIAGGKVLVDVVGQPPAGSYEVTVELGQAGLGLDSGSDVKVRGVLTGTVTNVRLDDQANAVATLVVWPLRPIPRDVEVVVTPKTFLGEKQVELRPRTETLDAPPFLADGDRLQAGRAPTEVQDFLAAIEPVLDAVDPVDLARVVDTFGSFDRQDAETAARNIEVTAELADFGARTAATQVARLSALADLTAELATTAADFNRLNRSLPIWVSILPDRQADVRANLEALSSFSLTFADFLEVEEQTIGDLLAVSTVVNGVLAGQDEDLASLIYGIYRYSYKLGTHGGFLEDGTDHGWFRGFVGNEGQLEQMCDQLPAQFQQIAPGCVQEQDGEGTDPGEGAEGGGGPPLPVPTELPTDPTGAAPTELPTDVVPLQLPTPDLGGVTP